MPHLDSTEPPEALAKRPRFDLKTLLAVVTLIGLCLGFLGTSPGRGLASVALLGEPTVGIGWTLLHYGFWITGLAAATHYLTGRVCPHERVVPMIALLLFVAAVTILGFESRLYELILTLKL